MRELMATPRLCGMGLLQRPVGIARFPTPGPPFLVRRRVARVSEAPCRRHPRFVVLPSLRQASISLPQDPEPAPEQRPGRWVQVKEAHRKECRQRALIGRLPDTTASAAKGRRPPSAPGTDRDPAPSGCPQASARERLLYRCHQPREMVTGWVRAHPHPHARAGLVQSAPAHEPGPGFLRRAHPGALRYVEPRPDLARK